MKEGTGDGGYNVRSEGRVVRDGEGWNRRRRRHTPESETVKDGTGDGEGGVAGTTRWW